MFMTAPSGSAADVRSAADLDVDALIAEYDSERPARSLTGAVKWALAGAAVLLSVWVLYHVFEPIDVFRYRLVFCAVVISMTFLVYRPTMRKTAGPLTRWTGGRLSWLGRTGTDNPGVVDFALAGIAVVVFCYPLLGEWGVVDSLGNFYEFLDRDVRNTQTTLDLVMGVLALVLILEAVRRTVGWMLVIICLVFIGYAYYGGFIPGLLGHPGKDFSEIIDRLYMTQYGFFGIPIGVAAAYVILFTIYGAVLDRSGGSRFFVDLAFAAFRRSASASGRVVAGAGFLLGTVSGTGTATAISVGSVTKPILLRAGYSREAAGGMLAAAGIGAILSPPTLGTAAFIIAELMDVSYLQVLIYAIVPTILYYLGIILAIEQDARRFHAHSVPVDVPPAWKLLLRFGYHFSSLIAIVVFMALGFEPYESVVFATGIAFVQSFFNRADALTPARTFDALRLGAMGVLPIAATCAAAGIIVSVMTGTGLGQNLAVILVNFADTLGWNDVSKLVLLSVFAAVALILIGAAVPVTASFVIAIGIIGPAFMAMGVAPAAYMMFVFYFAVLSEVSPPTSLAAVAASAVMDGHPQRTMWQTLKYTLPAFCVPFAIVLTPSGKALLWQGPVTQILLVTMVSAVGIAALAVVTGSWIFGPAGRVERILCGFAAAFLLYLQPVAVGIGLALLAAGVVVHLRDHKPTEPIPTDPVRIAVAA
jgi:TRAP transporter 4TM/12TM fusion protein